MQIQVKITTQVGKVNLEHLFRFPFYSFVLIEITSVELA